MAYIIVILSDRCRKRSCCTWYVPTTRILFHVTLTLLIIPVIAELPGIPKENIKGNIDILFTYRVSLANYLSD